jgi:hypothetical protein
VATTIQAYIDTTGALKAGGGNVRMDSNGISVLSGASFSATRAYTMVVRLKQRSFLFEQ